jgi:sec-independent protein translocase protein TatA
VNIPSGWELLLVVLVIMVLFGYKRLPDATRSIGRSLRIFKAETKGLRDDSDTTITTAEQEPLPPRDEHPRQP